MGDDAITVKGWREGEPGAEEKGQWGRNRAGLEEAALRVGDWGTKGVGYLADWALPKGQPGFNQAYRENLAGAGLDGVSIPVKERGLPAVATPENIARAQAVGDYTRDKYFSPTPGGDDIKGAAARIQAANPRGVQAVPQMARTLAQESQQRFAPQQAYQQPWGDAPMGSTQHALYQLDVMRQLRDSSPQQVQYSPSEKTQDQLENEEKSRRWRQDELIEMAKRNPHLQNVIGHIIQTNSAQNINQNNVAGRMNELALQGYNQLDIEGLRGRNHLDVEGLRGRNQLTGYGLQERMRGEQERMRGEQEARRDARSLDHLLLSEWLRGQNARSLKQMDLDDPYRQAQIGEAEARAGLYGAQRQSAEEQLKFDKSSDKAIRDWTKMYVDSGMDPMKARQEAIKAYLGSKRAGMANGGVVGYAVGGAVDSPYAWGDAASGITRKTINGIDHITDPNAPGGANYQGWSSSGGLGRAGGYGSFTNSAGKTFGDASKGEMYGGGIGRAYGANRDGDVTITPNQRAQSMNAFGAREYEAAAQQPGTDAYSAEALKGINYALGRQQNEYADGGAVQPMSAAEKLLAEMDAKYGKTAGNAPAPAPQPAPQPVPQPAQQPQGIADRFRGYFGSPDTRMKQNGLAFGGAVPAQDVPGGRAVAQAVAGRQVFGQSDGSGRDDALPAVIDGERPAALTSGEFVWPVNAVKYFGMAKLNKMLAEAEKGMAPQDEPA